MSFKGNLIRSLVVCFLSQVIATKVEQKVYGFSSHNRGFGDCRF